MNNVEDFAVTYTGLAMVFVAITVDDILGLKQFEAQTSWVEKGCIGGSM